MRSLAWIIFLLCYLDYGLGLYVPPLVLLCLLLSIIVILFVHHDERFTIKNNN